MKKEKILRSKKPPILLPKYFLCVKTLFMSTDKSELHPVFVQGSYYPSATEFRHKNNLIDELGSSHTIGEEWGKYFFEAE